MKIRRNDTVSSTRKRRSWLIPAVIASILFIGGVAGNLVANQIDPVRRQYMWVVWTVFGIALITAVAAAIWDARHNGDSSDSAVSKNLNYGPTISAGTIDNSLLIIGNRNVVQNNRGNEAKSTHTRSQSIIGSKDLRSALKRLVAGTASDSDREKLQRALLAGSVVFSIDEREVVAGKDIMDSIVITGDYNQVQVQLNEAMHEYIKKRLFPPPPGVAPPIPALIFVGREDALQDVKGRLGITNSASSLAKMTIVRGWPGVGKTTLVGVLARDPDVAKAFPDGILWIALEQNPDLLSIIAVWGRALGTDELFKAPALKDATVSLTTLLQHKRMLLIVDDVWDAADAAPFIQAQGPECGLLITTRLPNVAEALAATPEVIYTLPVLAENDAMKLMRTLAASVVEKQTKECHELVRDLEFLPLAIHVAGRLLKSEEKFGWGVTDLLLDIREGAAILKAQAPADRAEGEIIPTVAALLQKSTDRLDNQTRNCFASLGVFAPKPATFDLEAMKAVWKVPDSKLIVRVLVGHGLLEPVGSGRFQMHALLVKHARTLLLTE